MRASASKRAHDAPDRTLGCDLADCPSEVPSERAICFRALGGAMFAIFLACLLFASAAQAQESSGVSQPSLEGQPVPKAGNQPRANQGQDSAKQQQPEPEKLLPALQAIEGAIRDAIAEEDAIESKRQEQRDIDDLNAQKEMARWAKLMFWATAGTIGLTFAGLVFDRKNPPSHARRR